MRKHKELRNLIKEHIKLNPKLRSASHHGVIGNLELTQNISQAEREYMLSSEYWRNEYKRGLKIVGLWLLVVVILFAAGIYYINN